MKLTDFGKKKTTERIDRKKTEAGLSAARRLEQVVERLHNALGMGWAGGPRAKDQMFKRGSGPSKWECADLSVQAQASRTILAYAECLASSFRVLEKDPVTRPKLQTSLAEAVSALETLLMSPAPAVRLRAAAGAASLAASTGSLWSALAPARLPAPLAMLLDDPDTATATDAALALALTLSKLSVRDSWPAPPLERGIITRTPGVHLWERLREAQTLERIRSQLQKSGMPVVDSLVPLVQAQLKVLEELMGKWPPARKQVAGEADGWCRLIVEKSADERSDIAAVAFACASAMVSAPEMDYILATRLLLGEPSILQPLSAWLEKGQGKDSSVISSNAAVVVQAVRLLVYLPRSSTFILACVKQPQQHKAGQLKGAFLSRISEYCVQLLIAALSNAEQPSAATRTARDTTADTFQHLILKAIVALLRWPGQHHEIFLSRQALSTIFSILRDGVAAEVGQDVEGANGQYVARAATTKQQQDLKLRLLAWHCLAWLARLTPSKAKQRIANTDAPRSPGEEQEGRGAKPFDLKEDVKEDAAGGTLLKAAAEAVMASFLALFRGKGIPTPTLKEPSSAVLLLSETLSKRKLSPLLPGMGIQLGSQEGLEVSKTALAFMTSPNQPLGQHCLSIMGETFKGQEIDTCLRPVHQQLDEYLKQFTKSGVAEVGDRMGSANDTAWIASLQAVAIFTGVVSGKATDLLRYLLISTIKIRTKFMWQSPFPECGNEGDHHSVSDDSAPDLHPALSNSWVSSSLEEARAPSAYCCAGVEGCGCLKRTPCYFADPLEAWEGQDPVLYAALVALAELERRSKSVEVDQKAKAVKDSEDAQFARRMAKKNITDKDLLEKMRVQPSDLLPWLHTGLLSAHFAAGIRWSAAQVFASEGILGFPSGIGRDLRSVFNDPDMSDVAFVFPDGPRIYAHRVILASRCPPLLSAFSTSANPTSEARLPSNKYAPAGEMLPAESPAGAKWDAGNRQCLEAHMSSRVKYDAFYSLLEFVYTGQLNVQSSEERDALYLLARKCHLQPLLMLLQRARPVWGATPQVATLDMALGPVGQPFWDCVVCAEEQRCALSPCSTSSNAWTEGGQCGGRCGVKGPHVHAHRVVLAARSDYARALFRSGMRDGRSGVIVLSSLSQASLDALVRFLYCGGPLSCEPLYQACDLSLIQPDSIPSSATPPCASPISSTISLSSLSPTSVLTAVSREVPSSTLTSTSSLPTPPLRPSSSPSRALLTSSQLLLSAAVCLSRVAEEWMMEGLGFACRVVVEQLLEQENALTLLKEAAEWGRWEFVETAVDVLGPNFHDLRDAGVLDELPEQFTDAIRQANVKLWQNQRST
eukprot:TRINITY_DN2418_c0_g2_i1.p1 TRINITY_DN2418_c0_g2~~TRINITY_DN2418_c0_g2_i1.p1  ORF type:complete len:1330 (+),score=205.56 TRINITY_DN2418_c0_g2_i1:677-4666(+)